MISQFLIVHHCCIFPRKRPAQSGFEGSLRTRLCDGVSSPRGRVRRGLWVNLVVQAQVSLALPFALPSGETCPSSATKRAPVPRVGTQPVQDGEETQTRHAKRRASASTFLSCGIEAVRQSTRSSRRDARFRFDCRAWTDPGSVRAGAGLAARFRPPPRPVDGTRRRRPPRVTRLLDAFAPFSVQLNSRRAERMQDFQKETRASHGEAGGGEAGPGGDLGVRSSPPGAPTEARTPGRGQRSRRSPSPEPGVRRAGLSWGPDSPGFWRWVSPWGSLGCRCVTPICLHVTWPSSLCFLVHTSPSKRPGATPRTSRRGLLPAAPRAARCSGCRGAHSHSASAGCPRPSRAHPPPCRGRWPLGRTLAWEKSCPECRRDWGLLPKPPFKAFLFPKRQPFVFPN